MKILADTHIVLWSVMDGGKLSKEATNVISDSKNELFCSVASIWEIAIKHMSKPEKMILSGADFALKAELAWYKILEIKSHHIEALETLHRLEAAPPHNDPFDRMLIAQAKAEEMVFITHDSLIPQYCEDFILSV